MRRLLLVLVVLESVALAAAAGFLAFGDVDRHRKRGEPAPVFRPPLYDAATGDTVRYRIEDRDGNVLGYFDYTVLAAVFYQGTTVGRDFTIKMAPLDKRGRARQATRLLRARPRVPGHGWLPPRFAETDDYPSGARPVVKSVRSLGQGRFLVETVTPRDSLTDVSERYWIDPRVPVFGVRRWERGDQVWVYHTGTFGGRPR